MTTTTAAVQPTWKDRLGRAEYRWSPYLYIAPFFVVFSSTRPGCRCTSGT